MHYRLLYRSLFIVCCAFLLVGIVSPHKVIAQESTATSIPTVEDPRTAEIKKLLQSYYDEMGEGMAQYDVNRATRYYSLDYRSVDKQGTKKTLSDIKRTYKSFLSRAYSAKMVTEITLCTVKGDPATTQTHMKIAIHARRDDGIELMIEAEDHSRDFWMKRKDKWLVKQSRDFDFTIYLNGKKVIE